MLKVKVRRCIFIISLIIQLLISKAQEISNNLSLQYQSCLQNICQQQISTLSGQSIEALNLQKDNLKYNNCIDGQITCKFQFYLPFSQVNTVQCDSICFDNQTFITEEFKNYKDCQDECFVLAESVIEATELKRLQSYGECNIKNNALIGFPNQNTDEKIIQDIVNFESCIMQSGKCKQYNKDFSIPSFVSCFDVCSDKIYQTQMFKQHLNILNMCINQVTESQSDSGDSKINWSKVGLTIGIIFIILGNVFLVYRSYKKKLKKSREEQYENKPPVQENVQMDSNFQVVEIPSDLNQQQNVNQIPLLLPNESNQFNMFSINSKQMNQISQQGENTFHLHSQFDQSPIKFDTREESKMVKQQIAKAKIDNIFSDIEKEIEIKQFKAARQQTKAGQKLIKIQQQQQQDSVIKIDQDAHQQMLALLRKNFESIDENLKKSIVGGGERKQEGDEEEEEQRSPPQFPLIQYDENTLKFNDLENKCNLNSDYCSYPAAQNDEKVDKLEDEQYDFTKHIQNMFHNMTRNVAEDASTSSVISYKSDSKSKYDKQTDTCKFGDMSENVNIGQVK